VVALVAVMSLGAAACSLGSSSPHHATTPKKSPKPAKPAVAATPEATVAQYVKAWNLKDWAAMALAVDRLPSGFAAKNSTPYRDLDETGLQVTAGLPVVTGATARAAVTQIVQIGAYHGHLTLHSTMVLHRVLGRWLVAWSPALLDRQFAAGDRFETNAFFAPRAAITGAGGEPLVATSDNVEVGVVGERLKHVPAVTKLLIAGGATRAEVTAAVTAARAHPTYFEPVFEITKADYVDHVRHSRLFSIPGTQFEPAPTFGAITPELGTYLIGGLGPITAQQLHQLGHGYAVGDTVGQGGLEGAYEKQLAGTAGAEVSIVNTKDVRIAVIGRFAAHAGKPLVTTLSVPLQRAAETAISGTTVPAAFVAVQASTGELLAVATHDPTAAADHYLNYALDATEAPGSTFKTITSTALIADKGLTLQSPATCPASRLVDGEVFRNDEGEASGNISLLTAFAQSCNTAFIGLATSDLTGAQLVAAAKGYGLGTTPKMGYPAYGGTVPAPSDEADLASTSIGQGQITVSPLDMAMVAAAIDSGRVRSPRLVAGAPDDTAASHPVNSTVDADLKTMMAAVVSSGTAADAGLPAGTYAKTGTAEFGPANPPQTHAWLIGFRGDVAFAVFVNVGVSGGAVAAPLAAKFLDAIGSTGGA
jgi:hypothetical protein